MSKKQDEYRKLVKQYGFAKAGKIWREREEEKKHHLPNFEKVHKKVFKAPKKLPPKLGDKGKLEPLKDAILRGPEYAIPSYVKGSGKDTILLRGKAMVDLIQSDAWIKWLRPQIEIDISQNTRMTFNNAGEETSQVEKRLKAVGKIEYGKRILTLINMWLNDYKAVMSEE